MPISEMPWDYFVSYSHGRGFGAINIQSALPATTFDTVQEFRQTIARTGNLPLHEIVVLNFILLSGPDQGGTADRPNPSSTAEEATR